MDGVSCPINQSEAIQNLFQFLIHNTSTDPFLSPSSDCPSVRGSTGRTRATHTHHPDERTDGSPKKDLNDLLFARNTGPTVGPIQCLLDQRTISTIESIRRPPARSILLPYQRDQMVPTDRRTARDRKDLFIHLMSVRIFRNISSKMSP